MLDGVLVEEEKLVEEWMEGGMDDSEDLETLVPEEDDINEEEE